MRATDCTSGTAPPGGAEGSPRQPAKARAGTQDDTQGLNLAQVLHPYGVGVDTHSKFIQVCVLLLTGQGIVRHEASFPTTWEHLVEARRWVLEKLGDKAEEAFRYCIESTGTYHLPVIQAFGGQPSIVNPLLAGPTRRKTDVLDARLLAHHSITGLWRASYVPTPELLQLRVLWQQHGECARRATRAGNRLNNILLRFGHTFGALTPMRSREGLANIQTLLVEESPCGPGLCPQGLPAPVRPLVRTLLEELKHALEEAKAWAREALAFLEGHVWPTGQEPVEGGRLYELLRTVPGVGFATAMTWICEVGDPRRFQGPKQVSAYCGCDPSLKVSAGKVTSQTRRRGNTKLHWALVNAASGVIRRAREPLGRWGRSIAGRHRKGGFRKACGAVARRQGLGLWRVHLLARPFSYEGYTLASVPDVPDVPVQQMGLGRCQPAVCRAGFTASRALVEAVYGGECPAGIGDTALERIRIWVERHRTRHPPLEPPKGSKTYVLKPARKFVRSAISTKEKLHPCHRKKSP